MFSTKKTRRSNLKRARYVFRSRKNQKNKLASDSDFSHEKSSPHFVGDVAVWSLPRRPWTRGTRRPEVFYVLTSTQRNHVTNAGGFSGGVQRSI